MRHLVGSETLVRQRKRKEEDGRRFDSATYHKHKHTTTMDKDPYQQIHHATDKHLAELLRGIIAMKDASGRCYFQNPHEAIEIVNEAARRLENYQPREIFNHEAFE